MAFDACLNRPNVDLKLDASVTCISFAWMQSCMAIGAPDAKVFMKPVVNGIPTHRFQVVLFAELAEPELQDLIVRNCCRRVGASLNVSKYRRQPIPDELALRLSSMSLKLKNYSAP
jgi:hypothetical protein